MKIKNDALRSTPVNPYFIYFKNQDKIAAEQHLKHNNTHKIWK